MISYIPLGVAVLGYVLYHAAQRLTPSTANPFLSIGFSFALASLLCGAAYRLTAATPFLQDVRSLSWTTAGLGLAVALIEVAFLFVYRQGWPLGVASIVVTAGQSALLIPIGRLVLHERLPAAAWAGMALCLAGLALICLSPRSA